MSGRGPALLFDQLAALLDAGLPLDRALDLAGEAAGGPWRPRARRWAAACRGGTPLWQAMAAEGAQPLAIALLRTGEAGGALPACCRHLAAIHQAWQRTRSGLLSRLIYPLAVLHLAAAVLALPGVVAGTRPPSTLLAGPALLWLLAAAGFIGWRLLRRSGAADRLLLQPPFAVLARPYVSANLALALRAALAAGLRVGESFDLAADSCGNAVVAGRLRAAGRELEAQRRHGIAAALGGCGLSPDLVGLLAAGEAGGALDRALGQAATESQARFAARLGWSVRLLGGIAYAAAVLATGLAVTRIWDATYGTALREAQAAIDGG